MKKNQLFAALACFALLVTGCNGGKGSSSSTPASSSKPASSQQSTGAQSSQPSTTSSSQAPVADDDLYYSLPFPSGSKGNDNKWTKGFESVWTFKVSKNHAKMDFAFAAQMSSSSHGDRSLYTNHEGASSSDPFESNEANDGTCRIELKVNGVAQTVTTATYEEAGLTNSEYTYFRVASFAVTAGEVVVSMKTHAQTGYRLLFGDDARLFYPKADGQDPEYVEPAAPDAYKVTYVGSHCKVLVFPGIDVTATPAEASFDYTRDGETGEYAKYAAATETTAEVKPQVNFQVVCDNGYEVDTSCIAISGTEHNEWNHLDDIRDGIFSITTIKADLTVTITPVAAGTLPAGYVATFVTEHCSIKVYTNKKFDVEDTATPYMSRNKTKAEDNTFPYAKGDDAQLSFEVIPEEGYEFVPGLDVGAEAKAKDINWIAPEGYNKVKRSAANQYNLTKVSRSLAITIACTEAAPLPPEPPVEGTLVSKAISAISGTTTDGDQVANLVLDEVISVSVNPDGNNGKVYSSGAEWRLYQTNNAVVTVSASSGNVIKSVKFTFTNKNTATLLYGETVLVTDTAVEINPAAASAQFTVSNSESGVNNGQIRITAIAVVYDAAA